MLYVHTMTNTAQSTESIRIRRIRIEGKGFLEFLFHFDIIFQFIFVFLHFFPSYLFISVITLSKWSFLVHKNKQPEAQKCDDAIVAAFIFVFISRSKWLMVKYLVFINIFMERIFTGSFFKKFFEIIYASLTRIMQEIKFDMIYE